MAEGVGEETVSANRPTAFISYASQDAAVANAVVAVLERSGLACWIAPRDVVPGALYADEIVRAINECSLFVLVLSAQSVVSPHVGKELERASSKRRRIIALRTDAAALPRAFEYFLSESQWIEVGTGGIEPAATKLVEAVRSHLGPGAAVEASVAPASGTQRSHVPARRWSGMPVGITLIAVLALLLVAGGIQWALTRGGSKTAATPSGQEAAAQVSLAVLPFVNLSSDPEQEYFSDGLSEELLNQLAQIRKLRLTARTSSFSFKGKNEDVRVIGEKLGVGNVLEGSVRKDGTQLRITAQLINTRDGSHLWSQTYDRELAGVFALQEEIAKDVAQALSIRLDVGEVTRAQGGTNNVEAYDKFLLATAVGRQGLTLANKRQETQLYRDALALDPNFALAGYALYEALITAVIFREESAAAGREQADILARMELQTPDAWWTANMRVQSFQLQHRWSDAQATISAAQAVGSLSAEKMRLTAAEFLFAVGRIEETIPAFEATRRADPLSLRASVDLQRILHEAGRDTEAQAEYVRSQSLEGDHGESNHHALFRLWRSKDPDPKLIKAQFDLILENESLPMALTRTLARNPQDAGAARVAIRQAFDASENQDQIRMFVIALNAAHYGDKDLALAAMRRRFIDMNSGSFGQLWYPYEGNLRADPRFKTLLRDLGLVDYYRKSGHWPDYCKPVGKDDFECH